jgi:ATP adenylyltransferase/5',5'''-P-1,P-4-tetraphosphate phosphorylase II
MLSDFQIIRYLNYLLNISHDFIYIIGSRSTWILESSIVYWAGKEVVSRQGGRHLDLPLLALCQYRLCNISDHTISVFGIKPCTPPKFVVIQLGSNDLGTVKGWQLAENIICDILRIHALMPNTLIVWSDI